MKTFLYKWFFIIAFQFFGLHSLFAQINTDSTNIDSIAMNLEHRPFEIYEYKEYDFTAGIRTRLIPVSLIANNSSISSLSDALQSMSGIYMRSYGNGMLNGITIRGFGPERTSVLWNGIAINSSGLGQSDMNLIPGGFFNSIKLIEGGSSTQYGNGAQGGSLLLEYKPNFKNKFDISLQQEFGSFFTWNSAIQSSYGNNKIQGRTVFIRNSSNNNYAYTDKTTPGFPTRETVNADFFSYQVMQDVFFKIKKYWILSFNTWYTYTDRNIPPAMGAANNHSEQFDHNFKVMTSIKRTFHKHDFNFQVAYLQDQIIYQTDAFKDSSLIHSGQVQGQYIWKPKAGFTLMSGGNFSIYYSEYKNYKTPITELRGNVFVLANIAIKSNIKISGGIRQQFSTNYISYPSAHLGMDHSLVLNDNHSFRYKVGVNTAYRMPTLNDLYWVPGGNPNLKAEYSWNVENSWLYNYSKKGWTFGADALGYLGRTNNWIQWVPTSFGYWEPQNINLVQSAGVEVGANFSYAKNKWRVNTNIRYSFTHATNVNGSPAYAQLIYVPEHSIKGNIEIKWGEIYFTILPSFYSKRYTLSDNTQFLPAFFLLSLQAGYKLKLESCSLGFFGRLGNVTHADYQMILNRPMPGINFNVGINFYLNTETIKQNKQ